MNHSDLASITLELFQMNDTISGIAAIPTINNGFFINESANNFELSVTVKKYHGKITKKTSYSWRENGLLSEVSPDIKFRSLSPDGRILLVGKSSGEKERYIEIWTQSGCVFLNPIDVSDIHGDFCIDGKIIAS